MKMCSLLVALLLLSGSAFAQAPNNPVTIATGDARYCKLSGCTMLGDLKFTDATFDIGKSGATRPRDGFFSRDLTAGGALSVTGAASVARASVNSTGYYYFSSRSGIQSSADGLFELLNQAGTGFTRLNFGGTTSSFPAISRSGTTIYFRLADDSAAAPIRAQSLTIDGNATIVTSAAALTNGAGVGAGTITNAPSAGNPTKWIGINDNGTTRYFPAW